MQTQADHRLPILSSQRPLLMRDSQCSSKWQSIGKRWQEGPQNRSSQRPSQKQESPKEQTTILSETIPLSKIREQKRKYLRQLMQRTCRSNSSMTSRTSQTEWQHPTMNTYLLPLPSRLNLLSLPRESTRQTTGHPRRRIIPLSQSDPVLSMFRSLTYP